MRSKLQAAVLQGLAVINPSMKRQEENHYGVSGQTMLLKKFNQIKIIRFLRHLQIKSSVA